MSGVPSFQSRAFLFVVFVSSQKVGRRCCAPPFEVEWGSRWKEWAQIFQLIGLALVTVVSKAHQKQKQHGTRLVVDFEWCLRGKDARG